jgi:glycosyltransferase involved in cell wall biosynthesis
MRRSDRYDIGFYLPSMTLLLSSGVVEQRPGGAETQFLLLSRALAERGVAVCVVVYDVPGTQIPASATGVNVLVRSPYRAGGGHWRRFSEVAATGAAVRRVDARVIVGRTAGPHVGLVALFAKLARRRFVYSSAHILDFSFEALLASRRDRLLFRIGVALADVVIVQTEEQRLLCERRFGKPAIVIRSIAEPAAVSEGEREAFLWVGRIERNKQPLEFVELARALPQARFWMVASPSPNAKESVRLAQEVEAAAAALPNLDVLPPRPRAELLGLMARAVAVVSTSEAEGMPNIFLEGWARGIPALALKHDPDGIISGYGLGGCAEGDGERFVASARELWDCLERWSECGKRCRAYVRDNHSAAVVSGEWVRALGLREEPVGEQPLMETS